MPTYCPLCGRDECFDRFKTTNSFMKFKCVTFHREIFMHSEILNCDDSIKNKCANLMLEYCLNRPFYDIEKQSCWTFYYDKNDELGFSEEPNKLAYINLADIPYPDSFSDKIDRSLINIARFYPNYGDEIDIQVTTKRLLFAKSLDEAKGFAEMLTQLEYFIIQLRGKYTLSAYAWKHIEEIQRKNVSAPQAFIAMSFRPETDLIRKVFKETVFHCGFKPMIIDEKEHNNQIVPEIFYEIDNSMFLIMDVTFPNYGAYYEAGYALGKEKQVIVCCRENEFKNITTRPHFDIAQKSMIVWKNEADLSEKLENRIKATIHLNYN